MKYTVFAVLVLVLSIGSQASSNCGDWIPYKEEYCFKVFDEISTETYENAEKTCKKNESSLMTIRYEEEQKFLADLLFTKSKVADSIWIGASYNNASKYKWKDGSELVYSNWASGSPKNHADYCVNMSAEEETRGKWVDESCRQRNAVVCQKKQTWSLAKLQEILMEVKQNPVPVGFTYVQLPKEKGPTEIWPWMVWKDVSNEYAGVFFRAEGGEASQFGTIQEANSNRVEKVDGHYGQNFLKYNTEIPLTPGQWSDWIYTGSNDGAAFSWKLYSTPGEVRPRNMAMRIWKRIA